MLPRDPAELAFRVSAIMVSATAGHGALISSSSERARRFGVPGERINLYFKRRYYIAYFIYKPWYQHGCSSLKRAYRVEERGLVVMGWHNMTGAAAAATTGSSRVSSITGAERRGVGMNFISMSTVLRLLPLLFLGFFNIRPITQVVITGVQFTAFSVSQRLDCPDQWS